MFIVGLRPNTHFFKKACRFSTKKVPAASLKQRKHSLGSPKHAFSKKARLFFKKQKRLRPPATRKQLLGLPIHTKMLLILIIIY